MHAHSHIPEGSRSHSRHGLRSTVSFWIVVSLACSAACRCMAADPAGAARQPGPAEANRPAVAKAVQEGAPVEPNRPCPYTGEITSNDVLVRSGPGTNYYQCGKLFQGDTVQVLSEQSGWSRIVPPTGSFCWVAMQYVGVNLQDPSMGIVTGDGVGAYVGSDLVPPMRSTEKQVVLRRGDKVKLLGQETEDYLQIACPSGSSLWVSSRFVRPTDKPMVPGAAVAAGQPIPPQVGGAPAEPPLEAQKLKEFYQLQEKFKAVLARPLAEQDYTAIKKALSDLANIKDAGTAARYARHLLERIAGCELAKQVAKEVQQQDKQLAEIRTKIDKARERQLAQNPDLGRFCVIGKLKTFLSGGPQGKKYLVLDDTGRTICGAEAVGAAAALDLTGFMDQKVGLVGTIKPYPAISGAMVEFTEIVKAP